MTFAVASSGHSPAEYESAPAVIYRGTSILYRQFDADIDGLVGRLAGAGIGSGQTVGVHLAQPYLHWCVLRALIRLGAVSISLTSRVRVEVAALPGLSTIICAEGVRPDCQAAVGIVEVAMDWFRAENRPVAALPKPEAAGEGYGRICFTSGTSGEPKAILLDAGTLDRRLAGTAGRSLLDRHSVLWCGLGPDSAYGYTAPLAAWRVGGTVMLHGPTDSLHRDIMESEVNIVISSPAALHLVLRSCPPVPVSRMNGSVIVAGGPLTARLRSDLVERLCPEILVAYGSSEAGGVTLMRAGILDGVRGAVGVPFPDVTLEIVDGAGVSLPNGTTGRVRLRTGSCVSSYLNDPAATVQHFSEGWFYPGDMARMSGEGLLILEGRDEEVLNIDGVKLAAEQVEGAARAQEGIDDACALILTGRSGASRLAILAAGQRDAIAHLPRKLRAALPGLPVFSVVPVSTIPRGSMGKVNRVELRRRILELLNQPARREDADEFRLLEAPPDVREWEPDQRR